MAIPKILIVDDEPFNVDYLEQELEDLGYAILSAGDGRAALAKVQAENPDLVLLDINMPGMDGFEVLSRMKASPSTRDIPVIVISAVTDLASVVRGIQNGAEDFLPKPFEPTLLKARISSSLEKKRLRDLEQLYLKSLQNEMQIAREIQAGFLPAEIPASKGWDVAVYFKAAKEVAGDFYDTFLLPDGSLVCVIGDVCGKGVGAALFMTLFRSLIRVTCTSDAFCGMVGMALPTPADRLEHAITFVNQYVADIHADANMFATIFIGIFNPVDGKVSYINCGNEAPLWCCRVEGQITPLTPTGPVVGVIPEAHYSVQEIVMGEKDVLAAFTDGVPDTINSQKAVYGIEPLKRLIGGNESLPDIICQGIEKDLLQFIGKEEQFDDITLLIIRRKF